MERALADFLGQRPRKPTKFGSGEAKFARPLLSVLIEPYWALLPYLPSHLAYPEEEGNDLSVALSATDLPAVVRRAGRCDRPGDAARLYPHIWGFRFGLGFPIRRTPTNSFSPDLALITVELAVFRLG